MHSGMAQTEWGTKNYTQYIRGTLTIVLSAPHGGDLDDPSIPLRDCSGCTTVTDSYTIQLTNEIADEIYAQSGASPHVIISHLLRKKLDPNREVGEAANGNELAEEVYYDFHGFIEKAKEYVTSECGGGILFDIHGQSHAEQWIELGYLLTSSELATSDSQISQYASKSSIRYLSSKPGISFAEVLRGKISMGGLMEAQDYPSVPSPSNPSPNGGNYFNGGYTTQVHGSRDGGTIDAIQVESPSNVRFDEDARKVYARHLATSMLQMHATYYAQACKKI